MLCARSTATENINNEIWRSALVLSASIFCDSIHVIRFFQYSNITERSECCLAPRNSHSMFQSFIHHRAVQHFLLHFFNRGLSSSPWTKSRPAEAKVLCAPVNILHPSFSDALHQNFIHQHCSREWLFVPQYHQKYQSYFWPFFCFFFFFAFRAFLYKSLSSSEKKTPILSCKEIRNQRKAFFSCFYQTWSFMEMWHFSSRKMKNFRRKLNFFVFCAKLIFIVFFSVCH